MVPFANKPRLPAALRIAVSVAGALVVIVLLTRWLPAVWRRTDTKRDMHVYYLGAMTVIEGKPLYRPYPSYGPYVDASPEHGLPFDRFFNPPFIFVAATPLAAKGFTVFAHVWYLLMIAGFLVYAACLAHLATGRLSWLAFSVAALGLMGLPRTQAAMALGNIDPVLWALFGLALVSIQLRGSMFAAVALVKVHTMWPLALASFHDGRRIYIPAAIALLAGLLIGALAPGGLMSWVNWIRYAAPSEPAQGTFSTCNVSISLAGLRLARLLGWHYVIGPLPTWARVYLSTLGLGAPALTMWLVRKLDHTLQYACVTSAAVLFAPLCWATYLAYPLAAVALAYRSLRPSMNSNAG